MPSTMTHTYFGLDVYKELPNKYKNKIKNKLEYYKLFCQGSDPFMFYNLRLGKKAKKIISIQSIMHHTKTRDYFLEVINYIHKNELINNEEVISYLYGIIAHYYLDCYAHPFINYKGGRFNKEDKNTTKYNALHQKIEYIIDMYYIDKYESTNHKKFKTYKHIFNVKKISKPLKDLINESIKNIYQIDNTASTLIKSSKHMKLFFHIFNYDPYGIKLNVYKLIDKITPWYIINISELSYYNEIESNYLNLEKNTWHYPWSKTETTNESIEDIYLRAKKDTINTIIKVTDLLEKKELNYKELNNIFKNWSYTTGKDLKLNLQEKYFEF